MVAFNKKFNPDDSRDGDFNIVARGATSLIAKEIRGVQIDNLAATLQPDEKLHVDERKFVEARFKTRDLEDMLVSSEEAERRQQAVKQSQAEMQDQQRKMLEAQIREILAGAFKDISQGQKNQAAADAAIVNSGLDILEKGLESAREETAPTNTNS
jgi:hypothetical protein